MGEASLGCALSSQLTSSDDMLYGLPNDIIGIVMDLLQLRDKAACRQTNKSLLAAVEASLKCTTHISCSQRRGLHTANADLFLRFVSRCCTQLKRLHMCFLPYYSIDESKLGAAWPSFAAACRMMTHLSLLNVHMTDDTLVELSRNAPMLQHLAIGSLTPAPFHCDVGDEGMLAVALHCPHLDSIALFSCQVGDVGLAAFHRCSRQFRSLTLHNCKQVTRLGLMAVAESCVQLQRLDILAAESSAPQLDFAAMFVLAANCADLEELRISEEGLQVAVLDDPAIGLVAEGCRHLRSLDLVQAEVGDVVMARLASACTGLLRLRLEQTYVGDRGVAAVVQHCPLLQELRVLGCSQHVWVLPNELLYPGATEAGILHITAAAKHLTSLDISGLLEGPGGMQEGPLLAPPGCARLRHLGLDWLKLRRSCLDRQLALTLAACTALTSLSLLGYQGGIDQVLHDIAPAMGPRLRRLNLQHTLVADSGLLALAASCPLLETLLLGYCRSVTDGGLAALASLQALQHLDLHAVPLISDEVVAGVAEACPSLQEINVGHHHGARCTMSIGGYKALYDISRTRNTALNVAFERCSARSGFQDSTVAHLQRLFSS